MLTPVMGSTAAQVPASAGRSRGELDSRESESAQRKKASAIVNGSPSKWLIRLRRFATNEVDIVKVIVNNLFRQTAEVRNMNEEQLRVLSSAMQKSIVFKNLEPSSAYEICIESGSPNQQIGDLHNVLNANHFLKCQDTSDVELSEDSRSASTDGSNNSSSTSNIRRMDVHLLGDGSRTADANTIEPLPKPLARQQPEAVELQQQMKGDKVKMKSLCREFFTLPSGSSGSVSFGQALQVERPNQSNNGSNNLTIPAGPSRRPKSLNEALSLKSHTEMYEINDPLGLMATRQGAPMNSFEVSTFSRPADQQSANQPNPLSPSASSTVATPTASSSWWLTTLLRPPTASTGSGNLLLDSSSSSSPEVNSPNHRLSSLGPSLLPIVGCVLILIFIITVANMILNSITCGSAPGTRSNRRKGPKNRPSSGDARRSLARRSLLTVARGGGGGGSSASPSPRPGACSGNNQLLASGCSLYSSGGGSRSDLSHSRILVIGKHGEPFGAASAYFDVPPVAVCSPGSTPSGDLMKHQNGKTMATTGLLGTSSAHMLQDANVRFPLGPSFDGDERHNADMVGLARRNYDNFISQIYNNHNLTDTVTAEQTMSRLQARQSGHISQSSADLDPNSSRQVDESLASSSRSSSDATTVGNNSQQHLVIKKGGRSSNGNKYHLSHQRIKFDKVNPIYNMDVAMQQVDSNNQVDGQQSQAGNKAVRAPTMASFGYAATKQNRDKKRQQVCRLCNAQQSKLAAEAKRLEDLCDCRATAAAANEQHNCSDYELTGEPLAQTSNDEGAPYYKCCLDKQKQRFHAQQQQLERVMSKNGSLVPQPFINTANCDMNTGAPFESSASASSSLSTPSNNNNIIECTCQQQLQKQPHQSDANRERIGAANGDRRCFHFGDKDETSSAKSDRTLPEPPEPLSSTQNTPTNSPAPPELVSEQPGPKTSTQSAIGDGSMTKAGKGSAPLVMQQHAMAHDNQAEIINRTDFDQRRNELASKLQFQATNHQ